MPSDFTILRVDGSARRERSLSRALADRFVEQWRARWPDDALLHRDVGSAPPPAVSEAWIGAAFTRFQTIRLTRKFPSLSNLLLSYGSCQFPTMGFVVERYKAIANFVPEQFWYIQGEDRPGSFLDICVIISLFRK